MLGFKIANKTLDHNEIPKKLVIKKELKEYNKCQARIWDNGKGSQCNNTVHSDTNCLCKSHHNACITRMPDNKWWLGLIGEQRPESPINPNNGIVHKWVYDNHGNKIITDENDEIKDEVK